MPEAIVISVTDNRTSADIVSLAEVKNYLRITNTTDDTEIQDMIDNSIDAVERYLEQDVFAKSRQMYVDSVCDSINLYYAPIDTSVDLSVRLGGEITDDFEQLGVQDPLIKFQGSRNDVLIAYTTKGITDLSKIKQGIKARVAWLYYGREAEMSTNWKAFLSPYRRFGFYGTI